MVDRCWCQPHLHRQCILLPPLLALVDPSVSWEIFMIIPVELSCKSFHWNLKATQKFPQFSTKPQSWFFKRLLWSDLLFAHHCQLGWVSHRQISMVLRDVKHPRNSFVLTCKTRRGLIKTFIRLKTWWNGCSHSGCLWCFLFVYHIILTYWHNMIDKRLEKTEEQASSSEPYLLSIVSWTNSSLWIGLSEFFIFSEAVHTLRLELHRNTTSHGRTVTV